MFTHHSFVRKVWKMCKFFDLKAAKNKWATKLIVNCLKKLPMERVTSLDTKWAQICSFMETKTNEATLTAPFSDFLVDFRKVFKFTDDQVLGPGFNVN